jgi:trimethylamine--corrinoid protein Co-methyltransferase
VTTTRLSIWSHSECRRVHEATLDVLADPGVDVQNARAIELLADGGASVDGSRVRIPAKLVDEALASAPKSFDVKSRGGHEPLVIEQGRTYYGTGGDCIYTRDLDSGERRRARLADNRDLAVLSERLAGIDFVMSMGMAEDGPAQNPELAEFAALLKGTRKPLVVDPICEPETLAVLRRMAALAGEPESFILYIMSTSPLTHSESAIGRVVGCAELGIPAIYSAGASMGFTAPVSRSAMVVESNAEVLTGLVVSQLAKAGAPFVFGATAPAMSMRTTSIVYVAPEGLAMQQALTDLGRFYGLPSWTIGGCSDSNTLDGQWAAETASSLTIAALSGGTLLHDVGYLESGLQSSHESIVFADELIGYARAYLAAAPLDDLEAGVAEIRAVGPGGDHLARSYTRKHFRELWQPTVIDQWVHDHWAADGSMTLLDRLTARARELRTQPRVFELEASVAEELDRMVADPGIARGEER